jgi:L-fuconolactonase
MIIDAHHHYWNYDPLAYDWIDDAMKAIRRDFLPEHLSSALAEAGVDGVITVQARQMIEETEWLLEMARQTPFMKGVVGWLPLTEDNLECHLIRFSEEPLLKGLRHVIQGEADPEFMLRPDFNRGIALLKKYGFVYDILIVERQLPNTIKMVDKHPYQPFVLDHIAKPLIGKNELSPWKENIRELAKRPNVCCKLSGMVTEADYQLWTPEQLQPYFEVVMEAFGPDRLLYGSDWPVCLVATSYNSWAELVKKNIAAFSPEEQAGIMGGNAQRVYRLQ